MKKLNYIILGVVLTVLFVNSAEAQLRVLTIPQGGTGTGTKPTFGQILVGNSGGTYTLTATSSLGLTQWPFTTTDTNFGVSVQSTTTPLWFRGSPWSLFASSTAVFDTATATALTVKGDSYFPSSGTWNSSGRVGIGTTSPWASLSVTNTATNPSFIVEDASPDTSPFLIDANGNVIVGGLSTYVITGSTAPRLQVQNAGAASTGLFTFSTNASTNSQFQQAHSCGATLGDYTACADGTTIGQFSFGASDGTAIEKAAGISARIDGTVSTGIVPGAIDFSTNDSAGSPRTRLTIDANGNIYTGTAANTFTGFGIRLSDPTNPLTVGATTTTTTAQQLALRSFRGAIASGSLIGGISFMSNDTSLTAPGLKVAGIDAVGNQTHTASALGTDITFNSTNGTTYAELMRMTGAGNLGIGTTTPPRHLSISNNDSLSQILLEDLNATANTKLFGLKSALGDFSINSMTDGLVSTPRLVINSSTGNVGIGTTDPIGKLDIAGGNTSAATALGDAGLADFAGYINSPYVSFGEYQNYLLQTEAFNTTWQKTNIGTITSNSAIAPEGTLIAENIPAETVVDGTGQVFQDVTDSTTGSWTFSVWLKAQSGTATINLRIDSDAETGTNKPITLTTAWKRYSVTQTLSSAHTTKTVRILNANNAIAAWGAQLEPASKAGVYSGAQSTTNVTAITRTQRLRGAVAFNGALSGITTMSASGALTVTQSPLYVSTDSIVLNASASTGVTGALIPLQISGRIKQLARAWDIDGAVDTLENFWQEVISYPGNTVNSKLAWYHAQGSLGTAAEYQAPEIMNYYNNGLNVLGSTYGSESFTNGALTSGTSWSVANGFSLSSNTAVYVHNASGGTLTQTSANFAVPVKANRWYRFTWTSSALNTTARAYIDPSGISLERVYLRGTVVTPGTYTTTFKTNSSPGDFILTADSAAAGDGFTLDDLSLVEVQSGDVIANGLFTGGGTSGMKIDNNGSVGIGTTTPFATLDIAVASSSVSALQRNPFARLVEMTINGVWYMIDSFDYYGHLITGGPTPTVSSCGSSPTIYGNDRNFRVYAGSGGLTSCLVTFAYPYTNTPVCVAMTESEVHGHDNASSTPTTLTISGSNITSDVFAVHCEGYR